MDLRERVTAQAKPQGGDRRSRRIEAEGAFLLAAIAATPDVTLVELQEQLRARGGGEDWHALAVLRPAGDQLQKKPRMPPSRTDLISPPAGLPGWTASRISIPRSWYSSTRPAHRRRWRVCGAGRAAANAVAPPSHRHWKTTTFVAGLRLTGLTAPLVLDGPMTGQAFLAYVEQMLAPTLSPGDVVILDNLPAHRIAGVRRVIEAVGGPPGTSSTGSRILEVGG